MKKLASLRNNATKQPTLQCLICVGEYTELKVLPCSTEHAFCVKCLERCMEDSGQGKTILCPLCRKECRFLKKGVQDLESKKFSSTVLIPKYYCDMCKKLGKQLEAKRFCYDCNEALCENCCDYHTKQKHMKNHEIVDIMYKDVVKANSNYCKEHPDKQTEIYCYDCKSVVCSRCHLNKHNQHKCCHIEECAEEFRQQLNAVLKNITSCISESNIQMKILEEDKKGFLQSIIQTENLVVAKCNEIRKLVDSYEKEIKSNLLSVKVKHLKEMVTRCSENAQHLAILDNFKHYCEETLNKKVSGNTVSNSNDLVGKATELIRDHQKYCRESSDQRSSLKVTLTSSEIKADWLKNLIGEISISAAQSQNCKTSSKKTVPPSDDSCTTKMISRKPILPSKPTDLSRPVKVNTSCQLLLQPRPVSCASGLLPFIKNKIKNVRVCHFDKEYIRGVAVVGANLYVISNESKLVDIYSTSDYTCKGHVTLRAIDHPFCLAGCPLNNCLYISDGPGHCIHRVGLQNRAITKWSVNEWSTGLSITRDHNLLVALPDVNKLQEYTTRGQALRGISLRDGIHLPRHAVELSTGQFVVCYTGHSQSGFCIVDQEGHVVRSDGRTVTDQINPVCLAVDTSDHVIVADGDNGKVQLFGPSLDYLGDVTLNGYQLDSIRCMHFDQPSRRLYISEDDSGGLYFVVSTATSTN